MKDAHIKYSGHFTIKDTDTNEEHRVPIQVLYDDDHHVIVIYQFSEDRIDFARPLITGVINEFELDNNTTVAMLCSCDLLGSGEQEPEDNISWGVVFHWVNNEADIIDIRRFDKGKL